ncbi:MAG: GH3 family acyl-acid amido synthetase, partial [Chloroflexota bacterium]
MPEALALLREGRTQELWNKCCGFLDLSLDQFMATQRRLLMEQVRLMSDCELGTHLMRRGLPQTVEEFQASVPLTTYADYAPYLLEQRDDVLPESPIYWQRTSGRSGQYRMKWAPVTERMYREQSDLFLAVLMLASCDARGQVRLAEHDKVLYGLAPKPYTSGFWSQSLVDEAIFDFLPPMEEAVKLDFQARFKRGFELASEEGMDLVFGLAT